MHPDQANALFDILMESLRASEELHQDLGEKGAKSRASAIEEVGTCMNGTWSSVVAAFQAQGEMADRLGERRTRPTYPQAACIDCGELVDEHVLEEGRCDECFAEYLNELAASEED